MQRKDFEGGMLQRHRVGGDERPTPARSHWCVQGQGGRRGLAAAGEVHLCVSIIIQGHVSMTALFFQTHSKPPNGSAANISFGHGDVAWVTDTSGLLWFTSGVKESSPQGDGQWWQVPLPEHLSEDAKKANLLQSMYGYFTQTMGGPLISARFVVVVVVVQGLLRVDFSLKSLFFSRPQVSRSVDFSREQAKSCDVSARTDRSPLGVPHVPWHLTRNSLDHRLRIATAKRGW